MGRNGWLAGIAALFLLAGIALVLSTLFRSAPHGVAEPTETDGDPSGRAIVSGLQQPGQAPPERTEIEQPSGLRGLEHPYEYELECLVLDEYGLPIPGASIEVGPAGGERNAAPGTTGADGTLVVKWPGIRPEMDVDLSIGGDRGLRRTTVAAGPPSRMVLGDPVTTCRNCHAQPAGGMKPQTVSLAIRTGSDGRTMFVTAGGCNRPRQRSASEMQQKGLHPFARFTDPLGGSQLENARPALVEWTDTFEVTLDLSALQVDGSSVSIAEEPPPPPAAAVLEGTVFASDGAPVAGAVVAWGPEPGAFVGRTATDDDGVFRAELLTFGRLHVRAGGSDDGVAISEVTLASGETTVWSPHLRPQATVRGRAVDADGNPLHGWRVEFEGIQEPWFDACTVREDGSFVLSDLPGGMGRLLLWRHGDARALPVLVHEAVMPDTGTVQLDLADVPLDGELRFEPLPPIVVDAGSLRARVWQEATGRGASMRRARGETAFSRKGLPAGWYRVELRADRLGWQELARTWVDGKGITDLGPIAVPEPGRLSAGELAREGAPEIYRRTGDVDVRIPYEAPGASLLLPPGDYWCLHADAAGAVTQRAFRIRGGKTTGLSR